MLHSQINLEQCLDIRRYKFMVICPIIGLNLNCVVKGYQKFMEVLFRCTTNNGDNSARRAYKYSRLEDLRFYYLALPLALLGIVICE